MNTQIQMKISILLFIVFFLVNHQVVGQETENVTGQVKTIEGKFVSQAHVVLLDKDLKVAAYGVSDDKGYFVMVTVKRGEYKLKVSCVGYEIFNREVSVGE